MIAANEENLRNQMSKGMVGGVGSQPSNRPSKRDKLEEKEKHT